jgi:anti-anti-sigma factor
VTATLGLLGIEEHNQDGVPVLAVEGELDLASAPSLCTRLMTHRRERFVVDLSHVGFCDSSGLRALLGEAKECRIMGGRSIVVVPAKGPVRNLLDLTGVTSVLEVTEDREAAVARLARR